MPNVNKKKLTRTCAKEKNRLTKFRLLPACILRKQDYNIRKICGEPAMPYSTAVRDWLVRMQE